MDKAKSNKQQTVYGIRPVMEAIESGKQIDKILLQNGLSGALISELRSKIREAGLTFQFVPVEKLNRTVRDANHQGVVALISAIEYQSIYDIVPLLFEQGRTPMLLMLDRVTDVRNLGAIARTAECTGVDAIIIPAHGSAQINEDAIKTSSGALLRIPVCREDNLKTVINYA
ncbi:MAG: 23S rRNA (guanosine(2251)-2'-O)-methyltransferase RlmB, partial [Bacteroidales bacterium]|nr:23S rRNA (guanosine(2251)-2'-O)-methyltransferase RlmB [Bacteroidales bacterium]